MVAAVSLSKNRDLTLDRRKRGQAFQPGHRMANRFTTARSTVAMRRWGPPAIVTLMAMAAVTALTTEAVARQARPASPTEATAPRDAGEPIMAIVSIKTQHVTFYDADGWILRAPGADPLAGEAAEAARGADEAKKAAATAPRETAALTSSLRKLEGLNTRAAAELAYADRALAAARTDEAKARAEDLKQKAAAK